MQHKNEEPKTTPTSTSKQSEPKKYYFEHDPLRDALFFVQDMLERSSLPFLLLGNTAKQLFEYDDPLLYDYKISMGLKRREMHPDGLKMLQELMPEADFTKDTILHLHSNGVPVYIMFLDEAFYFDNPDVRFYYQTEFRIPNPFNRYWEIRGEND